MSNSLNLELPYLEEGQAQKHVTVNDAFRRIDQIIQLSVVDRDRSDPPATPQEGERYLVGDSPTGAWDGHAREVAAYVDDTWEFFVPVEGWLAYIQAEDALAYYTGIVWELLAAATALETVSRLGVNTAADNVNRLAVRSRATLFAPDLTAGSNDVRIVATKGGPAATVSHVFQDDFFRPCGIRADRVGRLQA